MANHPTPSLIVAFVADLMFTVGIESAARQLGYRLELVGWAEQIAPPPDELPPAYQRTPARQLGEHLSGPGAVLLEVLTAWQPALLIFDLNNQAIPWRDRITLLTFVPATRRMPVLCFGSHTNVGASQAARNAGATAVGARSRFSSALPELIQKYARTADLDGLAAACDQPLSILAIRGLEEFNKGQYLEAHELLELAWREDSSPARELYRAIIQVGVAYLQIERGNYDGAVKMFLRLRQWIDPLPAHAIFGDSSNW
jgi:tetratricopeptide (TPR) repeat protein